VSERQVPLEWCPCVKARGAAGAGGGALFVTGVTRDVIVGGANWLSAGTKVGAKTGGAFALATVPGCLAWWLAVQRGVSRHKVASGRVAGG
jgi:hypothetical protein